jgi:hypothetical protein
MFSMSRRDRSYGCAARRGNGARLFSVLCGRPRVLSSRCSRVPWLECVSGGSVVSARCGGAVAGERRAAVLPISGLSAQSRMSCSRRGAGARSRASGEVTRPAVHAWSYPPSWSALGGSDLGSTPPAGSTPTSNQAMQLTASKLDVYASSVCHRALILRRMHRGLAAADLVSR